MQLVKKTQKDWTCNSCNITIKTGSTLFKEHINKWVPPKIYCCSCAKPIVEDLLVVQKKGLKIMEEFKSDNPNSGYMLLKNNVDIVKYFLDIIKSSVKEA